MTAVREQDEVRSIGALRVDITPLENRIVRAEVSGPFRFTDALALAERVDSIHGAASGVVVLDLSLALPLFSATRALSLCDRETGIAVLKLPMAVIAPWAPPGANAAVSFQAARLGLTRRVFAAERQAMAWAQRWMALLPS